MIGLKFAIFLRRTNFTKQNLCMSMTEYELLSTIYLFISSTINMISVNDFPKYIVFFFSF